MATTGLFDMAHAKDERTINPADLQSNNSSEFSPVWMSDAAALGVHSPGLPHVDSAVDLSSIPYTLESYYFSALRDNQDLARDGRPRYQRSDQSKLSTTASPTTATSFNQASSASSPSHGSRKPKVHIRADKTKTRAETQIKVRLIVDPVHHSCEYIHFPRETIAKPKFLASAEEKELDEEPHKVLHVNMLLVCATAVEEKEGLERALRRARGEEAIPKRPRDVALSDLDKDDPAHPQNGGEVKICEGCKERERKRFDRKKRRPDDEGEWWSYEDDRIIMINEKEYTKWKDAHPGKDFSDKAKHIGFNMRIACYCRHQEEKEKSPVGYKVIFTFKDSSGRLIAQHASDIFQITDDHKNKETAAEPLPRSGPLPPASLRQPFVQLQYPNGLPTYSYASGEAFPQSGPITTTDPFSPGAAPGHMEAPDAFPQTSLGLMNTNMSFSQNVPPPIDTSNIFPQDETGYTSSRPVTPMHVDSFSAPLSAGIQFSQPSIQQTPIYHSRTHSIPPPPSVLNRSSSHSVLMYMGSNTAMPMTALPTAQGQQLLFSQFATEGSSSHQQRPMSMGNSPPFSPNSAYYAGFSSAPQSGCATPNVRSRRSSLSWVQSACKKQK